MAAIALALALDLGTGGLPERLELQQGPSAYPSRAASSADTLDGFLRFRSGAWASSGFDFEALRPDSIQVSFDESAIFSVGLDAGIEYLERFVVFGTLERSTTSEITLDAGGLYVGFRDRGAPGGPPYIPNEATAYVGGLFGTLEVDVSNFGDFEDAWGLAGGLALTWYLSDAFGLDVIAEYRLMEFDYDEPRAGGDSHAGGSSLWLGVGLEWRF